MTVMRQTAIVAVSTLAVLLGMGSVSTAALRRNATARCVPKHSSVIVADAQAQVYKAREPRGFPEDLGVWGCAYGHRPHFLGPLPYASSTGGGGLEHETLAGTVVAYEESLTGGGGPAEWHVVVRDLRNGHMLHRIPTGTPLNPKPGYVGVGNVVAIVVKSNGAAAWIADDYERTLESATPSEISYFDVEETDKAGTRLLASGTDVDPSSLGLAVGGVGIGRGGTSRPGSTLYWIQGGQPFSALLN